MEGAKPAGWYRDEHGWWSWWDGADWVSPPPPDAVMDPSAPGFWLPLFHVVMRPALLAPTCLVIVDGSDLRIMSGRGKTLLEGSLSRIEVHRGGLGYLRLANLETGRKVQLTYGRIGTVNARLRAQIPSGWRSLRFDDRAARRGPAIGGASPGDIKHQADITKRLATVLVERGARAR